MRKTTNFERLLIKNALWCKIYDKSGLTHMTDLMTYPYTKATFPSNHRCFQSFSQHGAIHRGALRHGSFDSRVSQNVGRQP